MIWPYCPERWGCKTKRRKLMDTLQKIETNVVRLAAERDAALERVKVLEKFHKAVRHAYYAPPMEAAPITDHDHRQVSRGVCAALIALEGGKQDG